MSRRQEVLSRFLGEGPAEPLYVPDLTLWYDWHHEQETLPPEWEGATLPDIARSMDVPIWLPVRPWRTVVQGVEVETSEQQGERLIRWEAPSGELQARWILGPDGDWWQTEYPVKDKGDLRAALESVEARSYVLDPAALELAESVVGQDGIVAIEIPRRPYSDLLHELLGWSEGLMLLGEPEVNEALNCLEEKLQQLTAEIADLPGELVFSPDNLDGQFISPRMFKKHLASSYHQTAEVLHARDKRFLVHVGGPIRHLVKHLTESGLDGIEGIAGPPQSNATLAEARELAGPDLTLWGGVAQDMLVETYDQGLFSTSVEQAVREARGDGRMILGVADRVPVNASPERLKALPELVRRGGISAG